MAADVTSTGGISYDALGQRIRVRNFGVAGNGTFSVDQLMLFRQVADVEIVFVASPGGLELSLCLIAGLV